MFSQHTQTLHHSAQTVFETFRTLPPQTKWGLDLLPPTPDRVQNTEEGIKTLWLRDVKTVIEEYTETVIENTAPTQLAFELKLDDFAMSKNAPEGHLLPDAASLSRARKAIADGNTTHITLAINIQPLGKDSTTTLSYATSGQTGPKLAARLFVRILPNPAKNLLETIANQLDQNKTPSFF